jgi:hypothetical protein
MTFVASSRTSAKRERVERGGEIAPVTFTEKGVEFERADVGEGRALAQVSPARRQIQRKH